MKVEILRLKLNSNGEFNKFWSVRKVDRGLYRYLGRYLGRPDVWDWFPYNYAEEFPTEEAARTAVLPLLLAQS